MTAVLVALLAAALVTVPVVRAAVWLSQRLSPRARAQRAVRRRIDDGLWTLMVAPSPSRAGEVMALVRQSTTMSNYAPASSTTTNREQESSCPAPST